MNVLHKIILSLLALLCNTELCAADGGGFNLSEAAPGVFVHYGKHVSIEHKDNDDIANIGFIIGDKCIAVIDTGGSVHIGSQLLGKIRSISDKAICFVINTHIHFDHLLGNKAFTAENPAFVGHHNLAEAIEQNRDFFLTQFKSNLGAGAEKNSIIAPGLLIEKSRQLDLGNRALTLIPFPVSHSHNDLIVLDEKTRTLWSGDLIFRERIPSLTGSLKGWMAAMEKLRTLNVKTVIPGHGSVADSLTVALEPQHDYLERLLQDTRKAIAAGKFLNEAALEIDADNRSNWLLHREQHSANVSRAFTELEWE